MTASCNSRLMILLLMKPIIHISSHLILEFAKTERVNWNPSSLKCRASLLCMALRHYYPEILCKHFDIPSNYSHILMGIPRILYRSFKRTYCRRYAGENVILLEIKPHTNKKQE